MIVDPSILTPPNCVVVAVAKVIVPLELFNPLVVTVGIITPPKLLVVADGNE